MPTSLENVQLLDQLLPQLPLLHSHRTVFCDRFWYPSKCWRFTGCTKISLILFQGRRMTVFGWWRWRTVSRGWWWRTVSRRWRWRFYVVILQLYVALAPCNEASYILTKFNFLLWARHLKVNFLKSLNNIVHTNLGKSRRYQVIVQKLVLVTWQSLGLSHLEVSFHRDVKLLMGYLCMFSTDAWILLIALGLWRGGVWHVTDIHLGHAIAWFASFYFFLLFFLPFPWWPSGSLLIHVHPNLPV